MKSMWLVAALACTALAGCTDDTPVDDTPVDEEGNPILTEQFETMSYVTGPEARAEFIEEIDNVLTPADVYQSFPRFGGFSCCTVQSNDIADLLEPGEVAHLRITLEWTNTPQNQANLGLAPCVPYHCTSAPRNTGLPTAGPNSVVANVLTTICEFCNLYDIQVDAQDYIITTGLQYTITIEVFPINQAVALNEPQELIVPETGVQAMIVSPLTGSGNVELIIYGEEDYPVAYQNVAGSDGALIDINIEPGRYVFLTTKWSSAALTLQAAARPEELAVQTLEQVFGMETVATVPNHLPVTGSTEYEIEPADMGPFPWFFPTTGAATQSGSGDSRFVATLASQDGVLAYAETGLTGVVGPTNICFNCYSFGTWTPENFIDDDRSYDLDWHVQEAAGDVVVFTAHYVR